MRWNKQLARYNQIRSMDFDKAKFVPQFLLVVQLEKYTTCISPHSRNAMGYPLILCCLYLDCFEKLLDL